MFAADAPGKFAAENIALAGSLVSTPNRSCGTSISFFAQMSYCVNDTPVVMLCEPFSHDSVSSNTRLLALRDDGLAVGLGLVSVALMVGNTI